MDKVEEEILNALTLGDLQEQHRLIAETVGVDGLIRMCESFGGSGIYIPQKRELVKNKIYGAIFAEYDGGNIRQLAVKYGVSESTVYNVVRDKLVKGTARSAVPGQISIAEWQESTL